MEKDKRITTEEILYCLFFGLLFFAKGVGLYDGQTIFKVLLILSVLVLGLKIMMGSYSIKEIILMSFIIFVTGLTYIVSGDKGMLLYGFMIIGLKNVSLKRLLKFALVVWCIAFICLWLVSLTHMEDTMYRVAGKLGFEHIFRWSMGYAHPNVLHITYLVLTALILLVSGKNISWKHYAGLALGNLFVFLYSVSYTGVLIVFLLLAGRIYLQARRKINLFEKALLGSAFPICIVLSLISPVVLSGKAFEILNKILNTRLSLAKHYLTPEYISLFGTRLSDITTQHWTMDNAYVFALIGYGIIPFCLICAVFFYLIYVLLKQNRTLEALIVIILLVAGLTEPFLFNTSFKNIAFLYLGNMIFEKLSYKQDRTFCIWKRGNREYDINLDKQKEKCYNLKLLVQKKKSVILAGIAAGAFLALSVYQITVDLPEGYVVRRSYCEDISEDITLFEPNDMQYNGYYYMENFEQGVEIEAFTGDIVRMEYIRGNIMSLVLGSNIGLAVALIILSLKGNLHNGKKDK